MSKKIQCMKDLNIFQALNDEEKNLVVRLARGKSYKKGERIFNEGDAADTIYLVKEGKVLLYKISENGKEISLDILQENDIFGENTILDDVTHTMGAKAIEDTFVCTCSRSDFPSLLANVSISFKMIKYLSEKLNHYTEQVASLAFQDVKGRLLSTLVRLAKDYGEVTPKGVKIKLHINHQDLANLINASRVMVTNTVNELRRQGMIEVDQKYFYLKDQELIKEVC